MRRDFQIAFLLAMAAIPAGVALMVAPYYAEEALKAHAAAFFWAGLLLTVFLLAAAVFIALRGEAAGPREGHGRRMIALAGMVVCGLGFLGFAGAYFWPSRLGVSSIEAAGALAKLADLGWNVRAQPDSVEFGVMARQLPNMKESARYFALIDRPYSLVFGQVTGLEGLHYAADAGDCTTVNVNSGEFTDISELRGFTHLTRLYITQLPLTQPGIVDASALASLTNLTYLSLGSTRIRDVEFVGSLPLLKTLSIGKTLVGDISPLSTLHDLEHLDVRGARVTDLAPLRNSLSLQELTIDGSQLPSLSSLADLPRLNKITIIEQGNLQLAPLAGLVNLESLLIWGPGAWDSDGLDLAPLRSLIKLHSLHLRPSNLSMLLPVRNIEAIGDLTELKTIVLGQIQIGHVMFLMHLQNLEEVSLLQLPLTSVEPLRNIKGLKKMTLVDIPVSDISPLLALPSLTDLTVQRAPARADTLTELERRGVEVVRR